MIKINTYLYSFIDPDKCQYLVILSLRNIPSKAASVDYWTVTGLTDNCHLENVVFTYTHFLLLSSLYAPIITQFFCDDFCIYQVISPNLAVLAWYAAKGQYCELAEDLNNLASTENITNDFDTLIS